MDDEKGKKDESERRFKAPFKLILNTLGMPYVHYEIPGIVSYRIVSCAPVKRDQFDSFWPFFRASDCLSGSQIPVKSARTCPSNTINDMGRPSNLIGAYTLPSGAR